MNDYELRFRQGLKAYISDNSIKQSALAEKAGIRADVFSRILNTRRSIFIDEAMRICSVIGLTLEEVVNYKEAGTLKGAVDYKGIHRDRKHVFRTRQARC